MKKVKVMAVTFGIMLVITAILTALVALIISKSGTLPEKTLALIITGVCIIACFIGGGFASMVLKEKGIIYGLCCGLCYGMILSIVSLGFNCDPFSPTGIIRLAAILISGAIGGILAVNRKSKIKF